MFRLHHGLNARTHRLLLQAVALSQCSEFSVSSLLFKRSILSAASLQQISTSPSTCCRRPCCKDPVAFLDPACASICWISAASCRILEMMWRWDDVLSTSLPSCQSYLDQRCIEIHPADAGRESFQIGFQVSAEIAHDSPCTAACGLQQLTSVVLAAMTKRTSTTL